MSTQIRNFWLSHPEFWITQGEKQKEADTIIYNMFNGYDPNDEDDFGLVVYHDQFVRHFSRVDRISEKTVDACRDFAAQIVTNMDKAVLMASTESELVWYLMPWKHLTRWQPIFQTVADWLKDRHVTEFPTLNRFFMDTYKKAYTPQAVSDALILAPVTVESYDSAAICESHPEAFTGDLATWRSLPLPEQAERLVDALQTVGEPVAISLSGGVDSMLMCALLRRTGHDVVAIHIVYGNRQESQDERAFVTTYCARLGIPLYIYVVEWLRRGEVDREFYEETTRHLRFSAYRALERPVLLGHIQDDVVENIWTNFARGTHLNDLAKFRSVSTEDGVTVCRPWLHIDKWLIWSTATEIAIPYLKNTTPTWSNRGKFRNEFLAATHLQYGPTVDIMVLDVAERLTKQAELLDRVLYTPICESWNPVEKTLDITRAVEARLEGDGWLRIMTDIAHRRLGVAKPSIRACQDFANRISRGIHNGQRVTLTKGLGVRLLADKGKIKMSVHTTCL
jgi:tRNA(Ile)-lysidine synthetase-like protein